MVEKKKITESQETAYGSLITALDNVREAQGHIHCVRTALGNSEWVKADRIAETAYTKLSDAIVRIQRFELVPREQASETGEIE